MTPEETLEKLRGFDRQIIHGSRDFRDMADAVEALIKERASLIPRLDERIKSSREWGDVLVGKDRRSEAEPYYWMAAGLEEFRNELSGQNARDLAPPP